MGKLPIQWILGSFPQGKAMDCHSKHSASFLHLWMCWATCLLIPYLHGMVSNLWKLMSGVCVMQCHTQTPNIRLRWLHFLKQISFKFWSSLAFTGHLVQATTSPLLSPPPPFFKRLHWLGWWCTLMQTLVQDVSLLLWPMFYTGTCFIHFLCSNHTTLISCFLSRSRVTIFSLQYCKTFWQRLWYARIQGVMAITSSTGLPLYCLTSVCTW